LCLAQLALACSEFQLRSILSFLGGLECRPLPNESLIHFRAGAFLDFCTHSGTEIIK
jgi:hypothetical protein